MFSKVGGRRSERGALSQLGLSGVLKDGGNLTFRSPTS